MEIANQSAGLVSVSGVKAAAGHIGIKRDEGLDAALFSLQKPGTYAGVFTQNQFRSACVESSLDRLHAGKAIQAVLITSGNANAGTGLQGRADTELLAAATAQEIGCHADEVIVLHTGVIGVPLRAERLVPQISKLVAQLSATPEAGMQAADAMRTTDTFRKTSIRKIAFGDQSVSVAGVAKGAGMIHPRLATMLSVIVTDLDMAQEALQKALQNAVRTTFNAISVDGDTSPNDSVILLSTGEKSVTDAQMVDAFQEALTTVCEELAKMIVKDGEGATKFIEVEVIGAATPEDAEQVAVTVVTSPLVKTAFFGEDFNPGRIVSAVGRSGAKMTWEQVRVSMGDIVVFADQVFHPVDIDVAQAVMQEDTVVVAIKIGDGEHGCRYFTSDLTYDYVRINSEYTT